MYVKIECIESACLCLSLLFSVQGGCASVIVSLTVQCPQDLTPYSGKTQICSSLPVMCLLFGASELMRKIFLFCPGKLMSALLNGIHDRSTVVQKAYAFALGHLVRVSTPSVMQSNYRKVVLKDSAGIRCCICFSDQTAKDASVEKLLLKLNSWYLEKEGETAEIYHFP